MLSRAGVSEKLYNVLQVHCIKRVYQISGTTLTPAKIFNVIIDFY